MTCFFGITTIGVSMKILFVLLLTLGYFVNTTASHAQSPFPTIAVEYCKKGTASNLCIDNERQVAPIISTFVSYAFIFLTLVAFTYLIYGGLKWLFSGGDKGNVELARSHIIAAIIGLIIVFLSYTAFSAALGLFGIDVTDLKLPDLSNLGK